MPSSPQHPIPGSATAEYLELNKLPRREHQRRTSPHPEPTGNGGPRNGDYVLLGGAECGPPPPPTTRSRDLIPRTLPHRGRDKATEAARPSQLARSRSRPGEPECKASPLPEASSTTRRTADLRSGKWRRWGRGTSATFPPRIGQPPSSPQTPPSGGETGLEPSPPRAVRPAPLLTGRSYSPYADAPPQPVTARQRTSAGPRHRPPPPRARLPRRRARLAAPALAVARGRSDWPKAASIKAPEEGTAPPPTGASLQAVRPRRARETLAWKKSTEPLGRPNPYPNPYYSSPNNPNYL
nr:proline-rich receptor-like protein kinase PERK9 [Vicugna pacos]